MNEDQEDTGSEAFDAGFGGEEGGGAPERGPRHRQLTEDEYQQLMSRVASMDEMRATHERQFGLAFGKIGGIERFLQQLQAETPRGQAVNLTPEDLRHMAQEFPELAGVQVGVLQKLAHRLQGTGDGLRPEHVEHLVAVRLGDGLNRMRGEIERGQEQKRMARKRKDWVKEVSSPEFAEFLKTKPQHEVLRIVNSPDSEAVLAALGEFDRHRASASRQATRRGRFEQGVTPRGDGGYRPGDSDDDEFEAGFRAG